MIIGVKKMNIREILLILGTLVVISTCNLPPTDDDGSWPIGAELQYQVTLDGEITSADEWSDTDSVDMNWGLGIPPGPPYVDARVWAKNDDTWLYLLYRVEWPNTDTDVLDGGQISRFWGNFNTNWEYNDLGSVRFSGGAWDAYDWDGTQWYADTGAGGENNVEGTGTHDGTYYCFEMRKGLCSGDGIDWCLVSGETYRLLAGLYDWSISEEYHADIFLKVY
jgi:hypothetical protein